MDDREKQKDRDQELDRFWSIEELLPKKKRAFTKQVSNTDAVEIELLPVSNDNREPSVRKTESVPPREESDTVIRRFIPPHSADEFKKAPKPLDEYSPDNALIRTVRIYRPKSEYQYYEAFLRDAIRLYPIHGEPCERATFFSYVPQYSQLSRTQLEWYLWWRECLRKGEYLPTDYSYVLLYIYELINLSEKLEATAVQASLLSVWEHYRDVYHQLDSSLSEWICDFSLLHHLSLPQDISPRLLAAAMTHCTLKEFYFLSDASRGYVKALLAFCNNYDYHKSKFYTEENAALFDQWIPEVLDRVVQSLSEEGRLFSATKMDDSKSERHAYSGALCVSHIKRRIEVEYCSFSRSNELRYFITDVIKYTENLLRAHLGVRSRLTVYSLPMSTKMLIDSTLSQKLPPREPTQKAKRAREEEFERLYDLPKKPLSLSNAAAIERSSWETTERLIEAFEENTPEEPSVTSVPKIPLEECVEEATKALEEGDPLALRLAPYREILLAISCGDLAKQRDIAQKKGKLLDAVVDEINEIAVDEMGDILLEDRGGGFAPIEDYRELFDGLIQSTN